VRVEFDQRYRDEVFTEAREWLASLTDDAPSA
jgi:prephenate dehydratase